MPIIDIHTHCAPRVAGDPFGVAAVMRGTPVGRNAVTNFRGLPAVSYHEMSEKIFWRNTARFFNLDVG
jgi:hypothetical protein